MTSHRALLPSLLFAALAASAFGADEQQQVIIKARKDMVKLAKEVQMAEYRYYQRYNELNNKREYAIHCYNEAQLGSRFTNKYCQPYYVTQVEEQEAREFFTTLFASSGGAVASPAWPTIAKIQAGKGGYQQNVIEVTRNSPELLKLLDEHHALLTRYQEAYAIANGAKPPETKAATQSKP